MAVSARLAIVGVIAAACAGTTDAGPTGSTPGQDAGADAGNDSSIALDGAEDSGASCACSPGLHNQSIVVLSDKAELLSYDPIANQFQSITTLDCLGQEKPFSLAVDARGKAWIILSPSNDLITVDVNAPAGCEDPGYSPNQAGFGLFGMSFSTASAADRCERIFALSYSGNGYFKEGPGLGLLGVLDPSTLTLSKIASIDYDGGELAGTGDGRLFAFAGDSPAKLVEYDKSTGTALSTTPLTGLEKTTASAFAFFGGDIYFFTEATPAECTPCLEQNCASTLAACQADSVCAEAFACALGQFDITDDCGGLMSAEMQSCVATCSAECLPSALNRKSWVHRLDFDSSDDGGGSGLTLVNPQAPVRIVGADASTCVAYQPR